MHSVLEVLALPWAGCDEGTPMQDSVRRRKSSKSKDSDKPAAMPDGSEEKVEYTYGFLKELQLPYRQKPGCVEF